MYCNECDSELVIHKGELVCEECERKWSEIILSDKKYYNSDIVGKYNTIIAFEYGVFKELLESNQIYGVMFQIKDLYEIVVRIPVLITASICIKKKELTADEKDFLWFLMSKPLSFGDWRASLSKASTVLKADESSDKKILEFVDSVKKFVNSTKQGDIVFWRNETIAHGALKLLCDMDLYEDISARLSLITEFLTNNSKFFADIKLTTTEGVLLEGDKVDLENISGEILLNYDDKSINLHPFFNVGNGGVFFYDKYTSKLNKADIIEYLRGKKISLYMPELTEIASSIDEKETNSLESQSYTVQERALCEKFLEEKDYFEPKFITNWLQENIERNNKVMLLQMEEGMGKSTYVRAIDNLSLNLVELDEVAVRTFYINSTYNSRIDDFSVSVVDSLRKVSAENTVANNVKGIDLKHDNPKQAFADVLNHFKEYHYPDKKLLFVFDGIDELNVKPDRNITDFIPTAHMLNDDVYVLITSRTELASDNINTFTRNYLDSLDCTRLRVYENSEEYREFAYDYFKDKVISKIKTLARRNKIKDFDLNEDQIKSIFDKIQRKSILNITFLKEIFTFNFEKFCKDGCIDSIMHIFDDKDIYKNYMLGIRECTGNRYYEKFITTLCVLALVSKPLALDEIAYLSGNEAPNFAFLGFINSMKLFFSARRTHNGSKLEISHIEQRKAIRDLFKDQCGFYLMDVYEKIMLYLKTNTNFLGKEKSYMSLLESIFNYLEDSKEGSKADDLFVAMTSLKYPSTWTKEQSEMVAENSVVKRLVDYFDSSRFKNDSDIELSMARLIEVLALNYYILNRFELCDYYFTRAIDTYKKYENVLTNEQKFSFTNALTHYATYKLYINANEEGADLYSYSLKFTEDLFRSKARKDNGELYFSESYYLSEKVCMSNLYRGCGKYDKVLEILDEVVKQLPNCEEDDRKYRTMPFCYLGYGQVYMLLQRYEDASNAYDTAVKYYRDCLDRNIEFFTPDCMMCYVGKLEANVAINNAEQIPSMIEDTDEFIKEMQNINKHISTNWLFKYFKIKATAYKTIGDMENVQKTKDYAVNIFNETLSEENKNNEILRNLLQEIRDI